jgi:hypothetical protein
LGHAFFHLTFDGDFLTWIFLMLSFEVTMIRTLLQESILAGQWFLIPLIGGLVPPIRLCSPASNQWGAVLGQWILRVWRLGLYLLDWLEQRRASGFWESRGMLRLAPPVRRCSQAPGVGSSFGALVVEGVVAWRTFDLMGVWIEEN